ncbi:MAG: translation initiation factor IF-1, partial [Deltaproteobacteria bacterium]
MSEKEEGIEAEGTVEEALAGGMYRIAIDKGPKVLAYAS